VIDCNFFFSNKIQSAKCPYCKGDYFFYEHSVDCCCERLKKDIEKIKAKLEKLFPVTKKP